MAVTWLGGILIATGCGCLAAAGIDVVEGAIFQERAARALERELLAPVSSEESGKEPAVVPAIERGLIGRLEIPRLHLSVIVMEGDDDATLGRAVGHVRGTALPWEPGNSVMAGHRDTFFRPLKNIRDDDQIRLTTARGTFDYRVTRTEIVEPDDTSALEPSSTRSLTLVTCYPFVYVGSAPQRFVIHAQ
jgi:LPXTG-site transpeptidase (sortase) family protein